MLTAREMPIRAISKGFAAGLRFNGLDPNAPAQAMLEQFETCLAIYGTANCANAFNGKLGLDLSAIYAKLPRIAGRMALKEAAKKLADMPDLQGRVNEQLAAIPVPNAATCDDFLKITEKRLAEKDEN